MQKAVIAAVVICCALFGLYQWQGTKEALVRVAIPEFPSFPEPVTTLAHHQSDTVYFASSTPFDFDVLLNDPERGIATTAMGTLFIPDNASPAYKVPAMIVLHGSGGISPGREMEYGQLLKDNGYAALVIDYYAPRGVTSNTPYLLRVMSITEFDAIADAYAGLHILSTHPAIDPDRIGVMGFSYGGMATRFSMDERVREKLAPNHSGFAAFVDYYGPCFQNLGTTRTNGAPLLTLRGTDDNSNDLAACRQREQELAALGVDVETHVFEGAGHAWENLTPRALKEQAPYLSGCEIAYDENGYAMVNDRYIVNVPTTTSREQRIANRMTTGSAVGDCLKYGYVIGHDPNTKAKSDRHLLDFLGRNFSGNI